MVKNERCVSGSCMIGRVLRTGLSWLRHRTQFHGSGPTGFHPSRERAAFMAGWLTGKTSAFQPEEAWLTYIGSLGKGQRLSAFLGPLDKALMQPKKQRRG